MSKSILVTRPNHDQGTNYLFYWSKPIINFASAKGVNIFDLSSQKANLEKLISYLRKNNPEFVFFNGHGTENSICGFDNQVLIDINNCKNLLKDRIVYARCCSSGSILGPYSISHGIKAFIGYSKPFAFYISSDKITRPLEDKIASLFLEPSNLIPLTILKGDSAEFAHNKAINQMGKNLRYSLSSDASSEEKACAPLLFHNIKYQVILGVKSAHL